MVPIHELLNRIRWDPEFGRGQFEIAYLDRLEKELVRVSFERIHFTSGNHFSFETIDADGVGHTVPFHRVKAAYQDGVLIWQRR